MPNIENSVNVPKSLENPDPQQSSLGSIGNLEAALAVIGQLKWDLNGLIPAIVQDARTQQVLMMAYMNAESLRRTLEIGETVFWSRSRSELWHKGATSGNTQKVRDLRIDCDGDTLLILVEPEGPACHTGEVSCFYRTLSEFEAK